jgi:hypothetical protein
MGARAAVWPVEPNRLDIGGTSMELQGCGGGNPLVVGERQVEGVGGPEPSRTRVGRLAGETEH